MLAATCLLLSVVTLLSGTLAWLSKSQTADGTFTVLSDFEVTGVLSFQDGKPYEGSSILVPVSFNPSSPNYIGHLKYVVRYTGASPAYIRVRVLEQWTDSGSNEILPASFLTYAMVPNGEPSSPGIPEGTPTLPAAGLGADTDALATTGKWVDHRASDYCYYYNVPVQPKKLQTQGTEKDAVIGDGTVELTLIDQKGDGSLIDGIDPGTTEMGLVIEVEAVQPNRYREFWGLSALPF